MLLRSGARQPEPTSGSGQISTRSRQIWQWVQVSSASAVVTLISLLTQVLLARAFGASISMDLFLLAVSVPNFVMGTLNGVFTNSLVPPLTAMREDPGYRHFTSALLAASFVLGSGIALIMLVCAPHLADWLMPGLQVSYTPLLIRMLRLGALATGLAVVVTYLVALANTERLYLPAVLVPALSYLGIAIAALLCAARMGVVSLLYGFLAGYLSAIAFLCGSLRTELLFAPRFREFRSLMVRTAGRLLPVALATTCFTSYPLIDAYWAPRAGNACLSYMGYAERLVIAIAGAVIVGPSMVCLPDLSRLAACGQCEDFLRRIEQLIRFTLTGCAAAACLFAVLRRPLIRLLLERGKFDPAATENLSALMPGMLLGMAAMAGTVLLFKALHARNDLWASAWLGIMWPALYFLICGLLVRPLGIHGLVTAYAVSWWITFLSAFWRLHAGKLDPRRRMYYAALTARLVISVCAAVSLGTGAANLIRPYLPLGRLGDLFSTTIVGPVVLATFLLVSIGALRNRAGSTGGCFITQPLTGRSFQSPGTT